MKEEDNFMVIKHECPYCKNTSLRYDDYGYERIIFCTDCDYVTTVTL